jgi:uroporphyrinogen decarboxylase
MKGENDMTGRERMLKTLRFEEPDRPPHFEIMFELEKEAFGLQFPDRTLWAKCSPAEKSEMISRCMDIYEKIVGRYNWDALAVFWPWSDPEGVVAAKKTFGDDILIGSIVGGTLWSIESITDWEKFAVDLAENPGFIHEEAERKTQRGISSFNKLAEAGADFIHVVNDIAFNGGPFVSPDKFREIITPYLYRQVQHIKKLGVIPFVHTDGNIMPVLDEYLSLGAACFQSVDPMAGMDIAEVKRRCHGKMALMGNVQCSTLQDGPDEAIRKSALYCLENASQGGGYIFGTSNTIFPGMPLRNYEYMLDVYREFCSRKRSLR